MVVSAENHRFCRQIIRGGNIMKFSSKVLKCGLSPMRKFHPYAVAAEAKGKKIYHLNIGQPDIETPKAYFEAVRHFDLPVLEYAPSPGIPVLIDAIQKYYDDLGMHFEKGDILITNGGVYVPEVEAAGIRHYCVPMNRRKVFAIFSLGKQLIFCKRGNARIDHDIRCKIQNLFQKARGNVKQQPHAGRNGAEIPDMRHGASKLNMPHTLTAHLLCGDLDTALFADFSLGANAFIAAAHTLPILRRPKNALAEKAVALCL